MVTVTQEHQEQEDASRFQSDEDKERVTSRVNLVTTPEDDTQGHSGVQNGACVVARTEVDTLDGSQGCSTLCSDVEDDLEDPDEEDGWITELPAPALQHFSNGVNQFEPEPPGFGDVCVKNSSNVNLGNKTFYKGPVTIKQFVYTNPDFNAVNGVTGNGRVTNQRDIEASVTTNNGTTVPPTSTNFCNNNEVHRLWTKKYAATALALALAMVLLILVAVSAVILSRGSDFPETSNAPISNIPINRDAVIIDGVRTVGRDEWLAQPPASQMDKLVHPVPYVIISHTASNFCDTQSACTLLVRIAQNFHVESKNWSDIAYNFLTGGDGLAYVGRGWDYVGAHSFGYNTRSIGISFIGTFNTVSPPLTQIRATQKLIEHGVKKKYIAEDYKLLAHRQVSPTTSPGDALFNIIKTWPHWAPEP